MTLSTSPSGSGITITAFLVATVPSPWQFCGETTRSYQKAPAAALNRVHGCDGHLHG